MGCAAAVSLRQPKKVDDDTVKSVGAGDGFTDDLDTIYPKASVEPKTAPVSFSTAAVACRASVSFSTRGAAKAEKHQVGMERFLNRLKGEGNAEDEFRVLRQSVFTGRWTLFTAGGVAKKPHQYDMASKKVRAEDHPQHNEFCPFCVGNETKTPDPLISMDSQCQLCEGPRLPEDWRVRVIPNIFPLLVAPPHGYGSSYEEAFQGKMANLPHSPASKGLHRNSMLTFDPQSKYQLDAVGYSEVIIEDRRHNGLLALVSAEQVCLSLRALQARGRFMIERPGVKQVLYIKQWGEHSGGSLVHPHMQAVSLPIVTPAMENRITRAKEYHQTNGSCVVCDLLIKEILDPNTPASSRLVYSSKHYLCVVPYSCGQYRVSIVPRRHHPSWLDATQPEIEDLAFVLQLVMESMYHFLDDPSYNMYIVTADQDVALADCGCKAEAFHWFMEVYPRFPADTGGVELASGIRVVGGLPEDCAVALKGAVEERLKVREAKTQTEATKQGEGGKKGDGKDGTQKEGDGVTVEEM